MSRKRAEADVANIQEFCHRLPLDESHNSCARTEAILVSRKDSKSHLKGMCKCDTCVYCFNYVLCCCLLVSRVVNTWGPQTHAEVVASATPSSSDIKPTSAVLERLQNMEKHLGFSDNQPIPKDVYTRLKALEDRILYLESTSPEYFDGPFRLQNHKYEEEVMKKMDRRIEELRHQLKSS